MQGIGVVDEVAETDEKEIACLVPNELTLETLRKSVSGVDVTRAKDAVDLFAQLDLK